MTKTDILEYFKDLNHVYNDCTKLDTLSKMLDEFKKPEESYGETKEGECQKETVQDTHD